MGNITKLSCAVSRLSLSEMPAAPVRSPLVSMSQGRAGDKIAPADSDDEGLDIPIVDPVALHRVGEKVELPLTLQFCEAVADTKFMRERWVSVLQTLTAREGTVLDITEAMMSYEGQAALTAVRTGSLKVTQYQLHSALMNSAKWPVVLAVESWLRDSVMMAEDDRARLTAAKLWCLVMVGAVGEEAVRAVALHLESWYAFDRNSASCSGRGSQMIARVAYMRSMLCADYMWTQVMLAVEQASSDALWDWRREVKRCYIHPKLDCEKKAWETADLVLPHPATESDFFAFVNQDGGDEENESEGGEHGDDMNGEDSDDCDHWMKCCGTRVEDAQSGAGCGECHLYFQ